MRNYANMIVWIFVSFPILAGAGPRKPVPRLPPKPVMDVPYSENNLTRVDPHGSKNMKPTFDQALASKECLVCHAIQDSKLKTKSTALDSCFNCHNRSPHSGVVEHLKQKVTCTDCHTFHRGEAVVDLGAIDSGIFRKFRVQDIEAGLSQKNNTSAMLKKTCIECHKQQN